MIAYELRLVAIGNGRPPRGGMVAGAATEQVVLTILALLVGALALGQVRRSGGGSGGGDSGIRVEWVGAESARDASNPRVFLQLAVCPASSRCCRCSSGR
eukprot:SAG11_NODE_296_length_11092_cov_24.402620_3_plen_100_part_00